MAAPVIASLPEFFTLASGMKIRLTALDPTTGNLVAGVVISGVSIDVDPATDFTQEFPPSPVLGAYTSGSVAA